jgi:hypothetical protein
VVIFLLIMGSRVRVPPRSPSNIKNLAALPPKCFPDNFDWEATGKLPTWLCVALVVIAAIPFALAILAY